MNMATRITAVAATNTEKTKNLMQKRHLSMISVLHIQYVCFPLFAACINVKTFCHTINAEPTDNLYYYGCLSYTVPLQ